MKNALWIIALSIVQVLVNCETKSGSSPYRHNVRSRQIPYSSGLPSGLGGSSYYPSAPAIQIGNGFGSGQFGLSPFPYRNAAPYQRPVNFGQGFQPSQPFQLPTPYQSLPAPSFSPFNFVNKNAPVGGRSANRAGRLQYLHTRVIPSSGFRQSGGFGSAVNIGQQSNKLLTPINGYFPPTPSPSFASVSAAASLTAVPNPFSSFTPDPSKIFANSPTFSVSSSIPIAEGHSVGDNIAYTFNSGYNTFGTAAPQNIPLPQSYGYQSPNTFNGGVSPFSTAGQGFDLNYGLPNNQGFNDGYTDFYSNVFKRESKSKSKSKSKPTMKSLDKPKAKTS